MQHGINELQIKIKNLEEELLKLKANSPYERQVLQYLKSEEKEVRENFASV